MSRPITALFDKPWHPSPNNGTPLDALANFARLLIFLVSLPFLLVGLIIAGPVALRQRAKRRREDAKFETRMREAGRLMEWSEFVEQVQSGQGTAIIERFTFKDGGRIWWTRDKLQASDEPHTKLSPGCFGAPPFEFCLQMRERYTNSPGGTGALVAIPPAKRGEVRTVGDVIKRSKHVSINGRRSQSSASN
jgi:hypothetical protein